MDHIDPFSMFSVDIYINIFIKNLVYQLICIIYCSYGNRGHFSEPKYHIALPVQSVRTVLDIH